MGKRMVTVPDMAKYLGCSQETVRRMLREGKIPGLKLFKDWRMDAEQVTLALSNDRAAGDRTASGQARPKDDGPQ
ncbi:MAG: helix-turn-helix domain-containing protein [Pirellulales bacterium]|nr:helix-turn-helix domain-containing protein [Pirellulales bacterium]